MLFVKRHRFPGGWSAGVLSLLLHVDPVVMGGVGLGSRDVPGSCI